MKSGERNEWATRLDELDTLPQEPAFAKQPVWDALYSRLQTKKHRLSIGWYQVAACLVAALILGFAAREIMTTKKRNPGKADALTKTNHFDKPGNMQPISTARQPFIGTTAAIIDKPSVRQMIVSNRSHTTLSRPKLLIAPVAADSFAPVNHSQVYTPLVDSVRALVLMKPVKKQLPVVHANELLQHDRETSHFALSPHQSSIDKLFGRQPAREYPVPVISGSESPKTIITLKN